MTPVLPASATAPVVAPCPGVPAPARSFGTALDRLGAGGPPPAPAPLRPAQGRLEPPSRSPAHRLLESVDRARARLDGVLAAARSGRTFTAQELLGLQAEAYRTVQTVDLAVKAAEQGAQSVRQALATQV